MGMDTRTVLYKLATQLGLARNTMEDRLRLQKTVYLLQTYGLRLGYGFSWYRYGPYSQELVYDAYRSLHAEKDKYAQQAKSLRFSANTETWLTRFKETLGQGLDDAKQLELLASVSFVRKAWHPAATEFAPKFKEHKNCFFDGTLISDRDIQAANQKLDKLEAALSK
jgi:hypothetical protein